jgi:hypothetical protein
MDTAKNVLQICHDNRIPISLTYKKVRRLQHDGLLSVEKIEVDDNGLKVTSIRVT